MNFNDILPLLDTRVVYELFNPRVPQRNTVVIDMGPAGSAVRAGNLPFKPWVGRLNNEYIRNSDISKVLYDPGTDYEVRNPGQWSYGTDFINSYNPTEVIRLPIRELTFTVRDIYTGIIGTIVKSHMPLESLTLNLLSRTEDDQKWIRVPTYPIFGFRSGLAYDNSEERDWALGITPAKLPRMTSLMSILHSLTINAYSYGGDSRPVFDDRIMSLSVLPELRRVNVQDMPITPLFYDALSKCSKLSDLSLSSCRGDVAEIPQGLNITTLYMAFMMGITGTFLRSVAPTVRYIYLGSLANFDYKYLGELKKPEDVKIFLENMPLVTFASVSGLSVDNLEIYIQNTEVEEVDGYSALNALVGTPSNQ